MPQFTATLPNSEHVDVPSSAVPLTSIGEGLSRAGGAIKDFRTGQLQERLQQKLDPLGEGLIAAEQLARQQSDIELDIQQNIAISGESSPEVRSLRDRLNNLRAKADQFGDEQRFRTSADAALRESIRANPGFGPELREVYSQFVGSDTLRAALESLSDIQKQRTDYQNAVVEDSLKALDKLGIIDPVIRSQARQNPIGTLSRFRKELALYQQSEQGKILYDIQNSKNSLNKADQENVLPTLVYSDVATFATRFGEQNGIDIFGVDPSTLTDEDRKKLLINLNQFEQEEILKQRERFPLAGTDTFNLSVKDRITSQANSLREYLSGKMPLELLKAQNDLIHERLKNNALGTPEGRTLTVMKEFGITNSSNPSVGALVLKVAERLQANYEMMFESGNPLTGEAVRNLPQEDQIHIRDKYFEQMKNFVRLYEDNKNPESVPLIQKQLLNVSNEMLQNPGALTIQDYRNMFDLIRSPTVVEILNQNEQLRQEVDRNLSRGAINVTERMFNGINRRLFDIFKQLGETESIGPKVTLDLEGPAVRFIPINPNDKNSNIIARNLNKEFDFNPMIDAFANIRGVSFDEAKKSLIGSTLLKNVPADVYRQIGIAVPEIELKDKIPDSLAGKELRKNKDAAKWLPVIEDISERVGVDSGIFASLIQQESRFNENAKSPTGVQGVAQITEATARELGINRNDPLQALEGGAIYLKQMLDKYGDYTIAVAAYNSGPGAMDAYLREGRKTGNIAEGQTHKYVNRITGESLDKAVSRWRETVGIKLQERVESVGNTAREVVGNAVKRVSKTREELQSELQSLTEDLNETRKAISGTRPGTFLRSGLEETIDRLESRINEIGNNLNASE